MVRRSRFVAVLLCAASLVAQEKRAAQYREHLATLQSGSLEWFHAQAQLVEALLDFDVPAAAATANSAWEVATKSPHRGAAETMAAFAELAACALDGPVHAATWSDRAAPLPTETTAILVGHYHLARARLFCRYGDHAEELRHAATGQEAAEKADDLVLQLEMSLHTLHATPLRDLERVRALLATALAGPRAAEANSLRPWVALQSYIDAGNRGTLEDASPLLDEAEKTAVADGNRRALGAALGYRVSRFLDRCEPFPDAASAEALIEQVVRTFTALGDRREIAVALGIHAMLEVRSGDFARANELLTRAGALVKGRGMRDPEANLRHARFDLAVRSGDGNAAAELVAELEQQAAVAANEARDVRRVRAELESSERARVAAADVLRFAADLAEKRSQRTQLWAGAGAIVALGLLAFMAWRSSRRLLAVNRRLAEQVARTEAATAARTALEARMHQLERTQSLGVIAAGVAHDFNNLLTGILGNAELIAMLGRDDSAGELARRIVAAGKQAARMCHQMQQCALDEPLHAEAMDLLRLFHDMLPVLRASVGADVDIVVATVADRLGAVVDRSQLEQVLLNLVVNARDAKATRVVLRTAAAPVVESDPERRRMVTIEVIDNGEGMDPDVARRIFDPFFTTRFPGRGLGLAVASGIVARHGGTIEVHSERGRGTTFTILLPAAAPAAAKESSVVLPSAPASPQRFDVEVLVVDDDDGVRRVLVGMLQSLGVRPQQFDEGTAALTALATMPAERPIVMFVDLTMPGMEGHEVMRRARVVRPDLRIVLMSGHANSHVDQVARDLDPDAVLAKPFSLDHLRSLLAALAAPRGSPSRSSV